MLQKLLGFNPKTMTLRTESIAGITTFLTMSYILAVNSSILSSTGMDKGAVFTATALATALSTLLLAFMAKLPLAQAPSMGINAFFAFTLVQGMGYPWQVAMAALFVEGLLFILITFFNVREIVLNSIPATLRYAISVGIGMFIAFIGLKNAGIIVSDPATFVTFGPFTPVSVLALTGILLSGLLVVKQVKGALFYSILICTLIGIPLGVTTIPEGFLPISTPHSLAPTFYQFDFSQLFTLDMAVIIFTLLFMDMFDTIGTLVALTYRIGIVKENGEIPCAKETMLADAIGSTFGAILGCSTITTYLESASGVAEGGRSGFTSLVTGGMFLLSIFFAPIFLLIPGAATTGALVLVGVFMMESITQIDMKNIAEALPAFITIITMVLTYSVANGIILGMLCYVLLKLGTGRHREVSPTMYVLSVSFLLKFIFT